MYFQIHSKQVIYSNDTDFFSREYVKVIQRNFRTFMRLRNWHWFGIIQKTRPLIGMINIEEEIKLLENAAENAIKESEKEAYEKKRLENENKRLEDEKQKLMKRIETEQGDRTQFEERMAKGNFFLKSNFI